MSNAQDAGGNDVLASRTKKAFLSHMRHELRTPINAILGYSEILLEDVAELKRDDVAGDLQKIHSAGKQLLTIVNDMLDQKKVEASGTDITSEAFGVQVRHALRTPLNAVIGYSEILLETVEEMGRKDFAADLQKIQTAGNRLLGFLEALINLCKIEAGKMDVSVENSGASEMIQHLVTTIRPVVDEKTRSKIDPGSLLVVDDNDMNRDMLSRSLERQGHKVTVAEGGQQALELMKLKAFDAVLLDIMMPVMNGYEVLQRIKSDPALRHNTRDYDFRVR